jgi:hypothetical protein
VAVANQMMAMHTSALGTMEVVEHRIAVSTTAVKHNVQAIAVMAAEITVHRTAIDQSTTNHAKSRLTARGHRLQAIAQHHRHQQHRHRHHQHRHHQFQDTTKIQRPESTIALHQNDQHLFRQQLVAQQHRWMLLMTPPPLRLPQAHRATEHTHHCITSH